MREKLERARALLREKTPLKADCGIYCESACCAPDADGQGGVYLFPSEMELIDAASWASLRPTGDLGPECEILTCAGRCDRAQRPLGCMLFPLTPVLRKGEWTVRLDRRAWAMCPLMEGGLRGLDPEFVEAARQAVRILAEDEALEAFLRAWARKEREFARAEL